MVGNIEKGGEFMKRFIVLCCLLFVALISDTTFAQSSTQSSLENLGEKKSDYLEIANLEEEIIEMLSDFRQHTENESLPDNFNINFKTAKKIYVDSDIFSLETSEKKEIKKELKNSTYMWLLIINIGEDTYQVHIAKGLPLDDSIADMLTAEEIQKIKDSEGKWTVSGIELIQGETINYEQTITDALKSIDYDANNMEIVICGGLEHISQPVALVMSNNKVDLLIPLYDLKVEGTEEQIKNIKPNSADKEDEVYLYDGIMNAANNMESLDETDSGNDAYILLPSEVEYPIVFIVIVFLVLSSVFIFSIIKKQKREKFNHPWRKL